MEGHLGFQNKKKSTIIFKPKIDFSPLILFSHSRWCELFCSIWSWHLQIHSSLNFWKHSYRVLVIVKLWVETCVSIAKVDFYQHLLNRCTRSSWWCFYTRHVTKWDLLEYWLNVSYFNYRKVASSKALMKYKRPKIKRDLQHV